MKTLLFFLVIFFSFMTNNLNDKDALLTPYEKGNGNQTATYEEAIAYYKMLDKKFPEIKLQEFGKTDVGKPLHVAIVSKKKAFDVAKIKANKQLILLINNAIHPGEPEGVDASMMLARDLVTQKKWRKLMDDIVVLIVPAYNIGGVLNRSCCSRANQNGPEEFGFRGNARNLDLNRDFIKCDSQNARDFSHLFTTWQPDVFIDNHTTNGADYQYVMTYIATQSNKLHPTVSQYMKTDMLPALEQGMKKAKFEMCPYVYSIGSTPDEKGIMEFLETPRYSTGYSTLFNTIGFVPETHMLKAFKPRLEATYAFSVSVLETMLKDKEKIRATRAKANEEVMNAQTFPIQWKMDTAKYDQIDFKGYEAAFVPSELTGLERLYYDTDKPYTKKIRFYNHYQTTVEITKPYAYIIPQAWKAVIDRLRYNNIKMHQLNKDVSLPVESYYIEDYETGKYPYEGHYLHSNTKVSTKQNTIDYYQGDYVVITNQTSNRYIIETLEPEAHDSFFNWNFFDEILMRKEYFSPYIFEDLAVEILANDAELKAEFEAMKQDTAFANNAWAQLDFIYTNSDYYEPTHKRYPVGRLLIESKLDGVVDF